MRYLSTILFALIISTSLIAKPITGNGKIVTESRTIKEFSKIENNGAFDIEVKISKESKVEITAESNLIEYIETVDGGWNLTIRLENGVNIIATKPIKIIAYTPEFDELSNNDSGHIAAAEMSGEQIKIKNQGSGDIIIANLKANDIETKNHGSGFIDLKATNAQSIMVTNEGSGNISIAPIKSEELDIENKGSGDISILGNTNIIYIKNNGTGDIDCSKLTSSEAKAENYGSGIIKILSNGNTQSLAKGSGKIKIIKN